MQISLSISHKFKYILFLLLVFTSVSGQFKGVVVDADDNSKLQFASIQTELDNEVILSGISGEFLISGLPADSIWVKVSHLGYKSESFLIYRNRFNIISLRIDYNQIGEVTISPLQFKTSINSSAGSISVISPEVISRNQDHTITQIINQVPGVFMADGTMSTNRLTIRGVGSRSPYGTNKIRIYLDEIPLSLIDGTSSPENINPDILERIEILKGPSSAVYGAGLGGIIVMKPAFPLKEGIDINYKTSLASWSTRANTARISIKHENTAISVIGKSLSTNGFRQNSALDRTDLFMAWKQNLEKGTIHFILNYLDFKGGIPSSINETDFLENPSAAAPSWLAVKGFEDSRNIQGGISINYPLAKKLTSRSTLFSSFGDLYESRPFNIFDSWRYSVGIRQSFEYKNSFYGLKTGFEIISERTEWEIFRTNSGVQGETLNALGDHRSYLSGFLHSEINFVPRLKIEPGISLTILNYRLYDRFENDEDLSGNYKYSPEYSPRLGINYELKDFLFLYSSIGHGFSPPSLEETLLPEGEANTDLKPETGWIWDFGVRGNYLDRRLFMDLNLYRMNLNDLLLIKRISEDIFMGINAGKTVHHGAEVFVRYQFLKQEQHNFNNLILSSSFTISGNRFMDFIDDGMDYSNNDLPGIPRYYAVSVLDYTWKNILKISMNYKHFGSQWMDDANTKKYKGHEVFDIVFSASEIKLSSKISSSLFFGINNIFNKRYASMILVNAPSFGSNSPRYYYPGNPRNFYVGVNLNFKSGRKHRS